jgi:PAS domain S-box-containing protein
MSIREGNRLNEEVAQDLTEPKRTYEELRTSEVRYRRLFEAARDGILIVDALTRKIIDVNPFLAELLGYSRQQLLGKELWQIGLLQDAQARQAAFRQLQQTGYIRYEHLPLQSKDGVRREVEFISNVYQQDGRQVIQCNVRDITGRKEAEQALRSSEERAQRELLELEQVYKTSPVGLCFVNTALCYLRVNQRLAAINGIPVSEHLRRPIRDVLPALAEQIEPHYRRVISSGQPLVEQEVHGVTPARPDLQRDFLVSYYPVQGADGAVLGVSAAVQEVTERKRFEAQLRHTQKLESLGG